MPVRLLVPGTKMICQVYQAVGLVHLPDFTRHTPGKKEYAMMVPPQPPKEQDLIERNIEGHKHGFETVNKLIGTEKGKTCVFVLSGPSTAGINERISEWRAEFPDLKVACLNGALKAVDNADYYICFEMCAKPKWFDEVDTSKTTLITSPCAHSSLSEKWKGVNQYFAYLGDMHQEDDPRWVDLPLFVSGLATIVTAIQALHLMGFTNVLLVGADFSIANPRMLEADPRLVADGIFYWDGTKYSIKNENTRDSYYNGQSMTMAMSVHAGDKELDHFERIGSAAMAIAKERQALAEALSRGEIDNAKATSENARLEEAYQALCKENELLIDLFLCGTNEMLLRHADATKCVMQIAERGGMKVWNCSGRGVLDYNLANLEDKLTEILGELPDGITYQETQISGAVPATV